MEGRPQLASSTPKSPQRPIPDFITEEMGTSNFPDSMMSFPDNSVTERDVDNDDFDDDLTRGQPLHQHPLPLHCPTYGYVEEMGSGTYRAHNAFDKMAPAQVLHHHFTAVPQPTNCQVGFSQPATMGCQVQTALCAVAVTNQQPQITSEIRFGEREIWGSKDKLGGIKKGRVTKGGDNNKKKGEKGGNNKKKCEARTKQHYGDTEDRDFHADSTITANLRGFNKKRQDRY